MLNSIFQVSERHRVKQAVVGEETKFDKEIKERMRKEGLNFHPWVTEFTDICTRIRLAISHCFSATLSLLSIPETYSSSYICCRMKPFTVFRVAKDKGREKKLKSKLNWMCWIWVMSAWQFATLYVLKILLYCMHSNRRINKGEWKMTCEKWFIWAVNMSSSPHSNLVPTIPLPSPAELT